MELTHFAHHASGLLVMLGFQLDIVAIFGDGVDVHRTHSSSTEVL